MAHAMTQRTLRVQNRIFAGTTGISQENCRFGFVPAFMDQETGSVYLSCTADGNPAPVHILDGLPEHLVLARNDSGHVAAVKGTIVAGFIRDGHFYTREQADRCV